MLDYNCSDIHPLIITDKGGFVFLSKSLKGCKVLVPKAGFEPAHPGGRQTLNLVRLPFRHFGT